MIFLESEERKFHLTKNQLDNQHNEYLSYLEISIVTIATAIISGVVYFLTIREMDSAFYSASFGIMLMVISAIYFQKRLKDVRQKINDLESWHS